MGGRRLGGKGLWACVCASVAAAGVVFAITTTAAVAQEASVTATASFPRLDRRAQVAPSAEFEHLKALARSNGRVRVIVGLRVAFTPEGALSSAAQDAQHRAIASATAAVRRALTGTDHRVTRTFDLLPLVVLELSEGAVARLEASGLAATLWEDTPRPPSTIADDAARAKALPHGTGGVAIALLDTGVDRAHLRTARVVGEACFSANGNCPNGTTQQVGPGAGRSCDYAAGECQHGTLVAGIAGGPTAPDVIAIQVFSRFTGEQCQYDAEESCALSFESDHIAGLQHVFQLHNRFNIGAATLSLGNGLVTLGCNDNPLKAAIDNLGSVGITTLFALGSGFRNAADVPDCISMAPKGPTANLKPAAKLALPDLTLIDGLLTQDSPNRNAQFAIRGIDTTFAWAHKTKNLPLKGHATMVAPASQTAAGFLVGTKFLPEGEKLRVPKLRPGKADGGFTTFTENFPPIFDYGNYRSQVCANKGSPKVEERTEENNCIETDSIAVIPRHLKGTIEGKIEIPGTGAIQKWTGDVDFVLNSVDEKHSDIFNYFPAAGASIEITVSGDSGIVIDGRKCLWVGGGTYTLRESDKGYIRLRVPHPAYDFQSIEFRNGFITFYGLDCLGGANIPQDMSGMPWMYSGGSTRGLPKFGPWHLGGKSTSQIAVATYTWNLDASDE